MKYHIIRFVFFCLFIVLGITGYAQDLMARQAPLDRKLKAVDSVSLQRAIRQEMSEMISDIYPVWSNEHVNVYKDFAKPNTFPIDLRGFSMPTPSRVITSRYGYRRSFRRYHYGLDVKVYTGDTIYAAFSGKARIVSYDRRDMVIILFCVMLMVWKPFMDIYPDNSYMKMILSDLASL